MFEISWSELLILAVVTLLFVGPKELPVFLRTIGRYAGTVRRHAAEFRSQFDAAMREAELDSMKKEMDGMQASVNAEVMSATKSFEEAGAAAKFDPSSITTPISAQANSMASTTIAGPLEAASVPAAANVPGAANGAEAVSVAEAALPAAETVPMPARPGV